MIIAINRPNDLIRKTKQNKNKTLKWIQTFNGSKLTKLVSVIIMIINKQF